MSSLGYFVDRTRAFWCGVIVFVAVGSLTMNLATRYSGLWEDSPCSVKTLHTDISPDAKRQRLAKDGVTWLPPVFRFAALEAPSFSAETPSVCAEVPNLLFDQNLYNRPPPAV